MTAKEKNQFQTIEALKKEIENYFTNVKWITLWEHKNYYHLELNQMYNYVDVSFEDLEFLSKLFNTKKINFNHGSHYSGCETCDYGSSYTLNIFIDLE